MAELDGKLTGRLKGLRVRVEAPDGDTHIFHNVPANARFFNKPCTNLLVKRTRCQLPFLVCVDEDLEYTGNDEALARAFAGGHRQKGWRILFIEQTRGANLQRVVEDALGALGVDGREPVLETHARTDGAAAWRLLMKFGRELPQGLGETGAQAAVGREAQVREVVSTLQLWQVKMPVIVGEAGVGKTNLVNAVARALKMRAPSLRVVAVDLATLMAGTLFESERENLLGALLAEAAEASGVALVLEHLDTGVRGTARGQWQLAQRLDGGLKLIGTAQSGVWFDTQPLRRRVHIIELAEPWPEELSEILFAVRDLLAAHHGVTIPDSLVSVTPEITEKFPGVFPDKAIALLDAASSVAALEGRGELSLSDLHLNATRFREIKDRD